MIGVAVQPAEKTAAREFFELCKTPWEFCRDGQRYEIILTTGEPPSPENSVLVLIYNSTLGAQYPVTFRNEGLVLSYGEKRFPIYGAAATFPQSPNQLVVDDKKREPAIFAWRQDTATVIRIGYNLFDEVRLLLSTGQPVSQAGEPTMELHIQLLRDLVTRAGIPLLEIPPVPDGHNFIACLTHDIDHPVLRNHCGDATMYGFLYRATLGGLINTCRGRIPLGRMVRNWAAAIRLPFVYLGIARDFWSEFDDYVQLEARMGATYFFIPESGDPGRKRSGLAPAKRACRYTVEELKPQIQRILAAGNEVGLHGLNAWLETDDGRREKDRIATVTASDELGVRMHWLYFDEGSPAALDAAGFSYDSTVGYNQTIGYRAGTTQVYRPLDVRHLLELPLHVMDTALFYPHYLNLHEDEAIRRVTHLLEDFSRFGGAFTINWHDRSIFPERLWGETYATFLQLLRQHGVWFATAAQAVSWFRQRRTAEVESLVTESGGVRVRARLTKLDSTLPGLRIRIHRPHNSSSVEPLAAGPDLGFVDAPFNHTIDLHIAL